MDVIEKKAAVDKIYSAQLKDTRCYGDKMIRRALLLSNLHENVYLFIVDNRIE